MKNLTLILQGKDKEDLVEKLWSFIQECLLDSDEESMIGELDDGTPFDFEINEVDSSDECSLDNYVKSFSSDEDEIILPTSIMGVSPVRQLKSGSSVRQDILRRI